MERTMEMNKVLKTLLIATCLPVMGFAADENIRAQEHDQISWFHIKERYKKNTINEGCTALHPLLKTDKIISVWLPKSGFELRKHYIDRYLKHYNTMVTHVNMTTLVVDMDDSVVNRLLTELIITMLDCENKVTTTLSYFIELEQNKMQQLNQSFIKFPQAKLYFKSNGHCYLE